MWIVVVPYVTLPFLDTIHPWYRCDHEWPVLSTFSTRMPKVTGSRTRSRKNLEPKISISKHTNILLVPRFWFTEFSAPWNNGLKNNTKFRRGFSKTGTCFGTFPNLNYPKKLHSRPFCLSATVHMSNLKSDFEFNQLEVDQLILGPNMGMDRIGQIKQGGPIKEQPTSVLHPWACTERKTCTTATSDVTRCEEPLCKLPSLDSNFFAILVEVRVMKIYIQLKQNLQILRIFLWLPSLDSTNPHHGNCHCEITTLTRWHFVRDFGKQI